MQDWAEVRRLAADGVSKAEIARRLSMSRTTVHELLGRDDPPRYERRAMASMLDEYVGEIRAMLAEDPTHPKPLRALRGRPSGPNRP